MREVGAAVAADHLNRLKGRSRLERIEAAINMLNDLGGSARFDESEGNQFLVDLRSLRQRNKLQAERGTTLGAANDRLRSAVRRSLGPVTYHFVIAV
jgi:hypothetical protein